MWIYKVGLGVIISIQNSNVLTSYPLNLDYRRIGGLPYNIVSEVDARRVDGARVSRDELLIQGSAFALIQTKSK